MDYDLNDMLNFNVDEALKSKLGLARIGAFFATIKGEVLTFYKPIEIIDFDGGDDHFRSLETLQSLFT